MSIHALIMIQRHVAKRRIVSKGVALVDTYQGCQYSIGHKVEYLYYSRVSRILTAEPGDDIKRPSDDNISKEP